METSFSHPEVQRLCAEARPLALAMAKWMVPPEHAEDVVHNALMDLMQQWSSGPEGFDPPRSLDGAVYDGMRKAVADFMQNRSVGEARDAAYHASDASVTSEWMDPARAVEEDDAQQAVVRAYRALPIKKREAHLMVREREMSYAQVGEALDVNERTARRWVQEGDQVLMEQLKEFLYPGFGAGEAAKGRTGKTPNIPKGNNKKEDIK